MVARFKGRATALKRIVCGPALRGRRTPIQNVRNAEERNGDGACAGDRAASGGRHDAAACRAQPARGRRVIFPVGFAGMSGIPGHAIALSFFLAAERPVGFADNGIHASTASLFLARDDSPGTHGLTKHSLSLSLRGARGALGGAGRDWAG